MKCDFCSNDANLEIVVFVNGKPQKMHLCSECYEKKLSEMAEMMPEEWGGKDLSEQIKSLLDRAGREGSQISSMEFSIIKSDQVQDDEDIDEAGEDSIEERAGENFVINPFADLINMKNRESFDNEKKSARDLAFSNQRKGLLSRRSELIEKMQLAIVAEEYEDCAVYRDQLDKIGESLMLLNEERKDPHGV